MRTGERRRKRKRKKNKWMAKKYALQVASDESTLAEQRATMAIRSVLTHLTRMYREAYKEGMERDGKFSRRPPASKSCLCMTMLRLADDPY